MKGKGEFSIGNEVWPGTSKLLEEMGELQQVLGKLMGSHGDPAHWDGSDLRHRLVEELADVAAALKFFAGHNLSDEELAITFSRAIEKESTFERWHRGEK